MRLQHGLSQAVRRISRRYSFTRRLSVTTTILTLVWFYAVRYGERSTFASHIQSCYWEKWEEWPTEAVPHRLVFVADPQLVDPHTYPGRPWPLSSLTEMYTDLYMARNFRLMNQNLDPDSVVFLGDLFDGGREWATSTARALNEKQRKLMEDYGLIPEGGKERVPTQFVQGEKGRWSKWDDQQWKVDFNRFGKIFFAPEQLYPNADRSLLPATDTATHPVSVENGANLVTSQEYAIVGGKQRKLMTSLPGNHDLGFGAGVQIPVRDRFETHFGQPNTIYVLGNHTFVSVDGPSLSAYDEYVPEGGEVTPERKRKYSSVWQPTYDFLGDLPRISPKVVSEHLNDYYPGAHPPKGLWHEAFDVHDKAHLKTIKADPKVKPQLPVILLSHVPLYRNPDTDCGKLREKGRALSITRGYQYQNVLTPTISTMLAKKVSAVGDIIHIFSGDDHDYCDVSHRFNVGRWNEDTQKDTILMRTVRDITVKSFSWAMGVRRPGFLLASLWNPVDEMGHTIGTPLPTIQTHLCLLPDQLGVFIAYGKLLGLTMIVLLVRAIVVGLRKKSNTEDDESDDGLPRLALPRYQDRAKSNGRPNGYASPKKESKGRQRASSTSTSTSSGNHNNLGVQRSYNARTRSVSPAVNNPNSSNYNLPNLQQHTGPLIDKAGYYPQLRWQDPDESDEESHVGEEPYQEDSQAKWRKRRRTPSKARKVLDEFLVSVAFVGIPSGLFYGYLIRNG